MGRVSNPDAIDEAAVRLCVCADPVTDAVLRDAAEAIGRELSLPVIHYPQTAFDGLLVVTPQCLELRWETPTTHVPGESKRSAPIRVDLTKLDTTSGPGRSHRQPLAKAVGMGGAGDGPPDVIDATGGMGEDAWLLAALGCRVRVCERHPVIAILLTDGLCRARDAMPEVGGRMTVHAADACQLLSSLPEDDRPDVVYLDPMFPPRRDGVLERKTLRVLRRIVGDDSDAAILFDAARRAARRRVVVKRPTAAPPIAPNPVASHEGKGFRFDVYPVA